MAKILISLIGDQTAPNIFMIRDERFGQIDRHLFITTALMEDRGRLAHLLAATGIPESNYQKVQVSAEDFTEVQRALSQLNLSQEDEYFLNLTSGTKIMSLGLFHFFTQNGYRVRIFYLPFRKNVYRQFFPEPEQGEYELSFNISLSDYLTIYGIDREPQPEWWTGPAALTGELFRAYTSEAPKGEAKPWLLAGALRKVYNQGRGEHPIDPARIEGLPEWLGHLNFPLAADGQLTPAQARYLIGGWLEQWTAGILGQYLQLPPPALGQGLKIRPRRLDLEGFGRSEFDVMFIYRNTLYILECKTGLGLPNRGNGLPARFDQSLYRLAALRMEFGMNVHTALLTPDKRLRRKNKLQPVAAARAQLLKISVIDRYELLRGPDYWVKKLVEREL